MRKLITLIGCILLFTDLVAQQSAQYSQFNMNHYTFNPAVGGVSKSLEAQLGYRTQWVGFDDAAPTSIYMSVHKPIKYPADHVRNQGNHHQGVGGYIYRDQAGHITTTGISMSYSYHLRLTKHNVLSFGAFMGTKQFSLDESKIKFTQSIDDPKVLGGVQTHMTPDATLGVWYHTKTLFTGVSINQVFNGDIEMRDATEISNFGRLDNHLFGHLGYIIGLSRQVQLVPSAFVKMVAPAPIQLDYSLKIIYDETFWLGGSFRNLDALVLYGGMYVGDFEFGYALDLTFNAIQEHSYGSHEIIVGFFVPRKERSVVCPSRYW